MPAPPTTAQLAAGVQMGWLPAPLAGVPGVMSHVFVPVESTLNFTGQEVAEGVDPVSRIDWLAPNPVEVFIRLVIIVFGDAVRTGEPVEGVYPAGTAAKIWFWRFCLAAFNPESDA